LNHYLSIVKQYGWIVLACTVLSTTLGFILVKSQPTTYQATSVVIVNAGSPGTTYPGGPTSTDSLGEASNYASQILSSSVMDYITKFDPRIQKLGYTSDYLLGNVITSPSTTAATMSITVTANQPGDAILLANDVAQGFAAYIQTQNQNALDVQRKNLQAGLDTYTKQKHDVEATILKLPTTDPRYTIYTTDRDDIIRQIDTLQGQLLTLPPTIKGDVSVIQLASGQNVSPTSKSTTSLAITAAVGLLVGILILLLVSFLDRRLRSEEQVKEKLGMAYLGSFPQSKVLQHDPTRPDVFTAQELADIGVNLSLLGILPDKKQLSQGAVLLITSAQVSVGKTSIATALSATLANTGNSILVIDGNIQHPATHLPFGMSSSKMGLSGLLQSIANIDDAVQRTSIPGIWIISGGEPVSAPALLLKQKMPALLTHLRQKVDVIIIDGPPLLSGSEASILAGMADGVALVVDARHDRLPLLLRAREVLNALTHVPVGVVMNHFPQPRRNHYYVAALPARPITEQGMPAQMNASAHTSNGKYSDTERKAEPKSPLPQNILNLQATMFPPPTPSREGRTLTVDLSGKNE
jgi:capsular exopolysaccharide synthesis family protein